MGNAEENIPTQFMMQAFSTNHGVDTMMSSYGVLPGYTKLLEMLHTSTKQNNTIHNSDEKTVGVHALMAEFTGESKYTNSLKKFCDHAVSGQTKSPGGMLHYAQWGSLRYAANAAFICLQASDLVDGKSATYTDLAQSQMDYIL